jgi:hypothetical protein
MTATIRVALAALIGCFCFSPVAQAALVNLARLGTASQSTTAYDGFAEHGNDGGLGLSYGEDFSTTHTGENSYEFWQVDLGGVYELSSVELFARGDCCPNRHSNFNINVYDAPSGSLVHSQYFGGNIAEATSQSFTLPAGTFGRIVQIQYADPGVSFANYPGMHWREIRVFGDAPVAPGTNLARAYGVVTQSSVGFGGYAQKGVDGNTNGDYFAGNSVTHTQFLPDPWYLVDLGSELSVDNVVLYNRSDCCAGRTRDVFIELLAADGSLIATSPILNPGNILGGGPFDELNGPATLEYDFGGQFGQMVRARMVAPGGAYLHLAEVEVYGAAIPEPSSVLLAALGFIGLVGAAYRRRLRT